MSTITKEQVVVGARFVMGEEDDDFEMITVDVVNERCVGFDSVWKSQHIELTMDDFLDLAKRIA